MERRRSGQGTGRRSHPTERRPPRAMVRRVGRGQPAQLPQIPRHPRLRQRPPLHRDRHLRLPKRLGPHRSHDVRRSLPPAQGRPAQQARRHGGRTTPEAKRTAARQEGRQRQSPQGRPRRRQARPRAPHADLPRRGRLGRPGPERRTPASERAGGFGEGD